MNTQKEIRRHGDVLIKTYPGFKIPEDVELKPVKVLFAGQNHDHYFSSGLAASGTKDGKTYLHVAEDSVISHGRGDSAEHGDRPVPAGHYYWEIQTFYDHVAEESKRVID